MLARPAVRQKAAPSIGRGARDPGAGVATPGAAGPYVGMSLSPDEIESILKHAGEGCPLGPCLGCPHNDVTTGACMA